MTTPIEAFSELNPSLFQQVRRVVVENAVRDGVFDSTVELTLGSDDSDPERLLVVRCGGVRNLILRDLSHMASCLLEIADISRDGWEDLSFRIKDVEEEVVLLYCRDFTASLEASE